jgi:DNA polymerase/3'-5' exonuclease PolX
MMVFTLSEYPSALMRLPNAPFKVWAHRRAGWTIDELDQDILAIYKKHGLNGLKALPNVGPSIAAFIAEKLNGT